MASVLASEALSAACRNSCCHNPEDHSATPLLHSVCYAAYWTRCPKTLECFIKRPVGDFSCNRKRSAEVPACCHSYVPAGDAWSDAACRRSGSMSKLACKKLDQANGGKCLYTNEISVLLKFSSRQHSWRCLTLQEVNLYLVTCYN